MKALASIYFEQEQQQPKGGFSLKSERPCLSLDERRDRFSYLNEQRFLLLYSSVKSKYLKAFQIIQSLVLGF